MNPVNSIKARFEKLRSVDHSVITGTYIAIGTPFANPARQIKFWNNTNADCFLSTDGINDYDFLPTMSGFVDDFASNKSNQGGTLEEPALTQWYVRTAGSATSGAVYLTVVYASQT